MFKKLFLGVAVAAAGMFFTSNQASADHCRYRGGYGSYYRPSISHHYSPYHSSLYRSYRVPTRSYYRGGYGLSPRSSFYGGYGFGSPFYGGVSPFGYGRSGITIGFGF